MNQENRERFLLEIENQFKAHMTCIRQKTEKVSNFRESDGVEAVIVCAMEVIENPNKFLKDYQENKNI